MNTPILFILFKRYDTALQVFNAIRQARPPRLYVFADAPREGVKGEKEECLKTRAIVDLVDWECDVRTMFQTENQGCGIGPYKAISWFFENEEQGIILEDDCLPHPDFFQYCEELLNRYKSEPSITLITGRNNFRHLPQNSESYFLSALHFCWGWASWRRVWEKYDYTLSDITPLRYFKALLRYFGLRNLHTIMWRMNILYFCKKNQPKDIWDYQFCITTQMMGGYTIVPKNNLIRNIGNDDRATHTSGIADEIPLSPVLPLIHPEKIEYKSRYDVSYSHTRINSLKTIYYYIRNLINC